MNIMNRFVNFLLSFETVIWILQVFFFLIFSFALMFGGEIIPSSGVIGLSGAVILLSLLLWVNIRLLREQKREDS
jgi:hypothetical protein